MDDRQPARDALPRELDRLLADPPRPARVLLVDDEPAVRRVAQRMLELQGYEVVTAGCGEEATEVFRAEDGGFEVVLLDLTMPGMDGERTLHALRGIRPDVRVVVMSGHCEQDVAARLRGSGPAGFLHKPFSLAALTSSIADAL